MTVLLVEDNLETARVVREALEANDVAVVHASTIAAGRLALAARRHSAVVLDLNLPDGSGLTLADELRAAGSDVPILMLTARANVDERVEGFSHGADDYLCKPFSVDEFLARLRAILRRSRGAGGHVLGYADLEINLLTRVMRRGELHADLSSREVDLLAFFMRRPEELHSRATILREVWGAEGEWESNVLNVYVNYLRNKTERGRYSRLIHTVRGSGYVLSATAPGDEY